MKVDEEIKNYVLLIHVQVNISIVNLPPRNNTKDYGCSVNNVQLTSYLYGNVMECSVPTSDYLAEPSSLTGKLIFNN